MKVLGRASLLVVLVWSMGVTVLRAVRLPNDFAEAHWLIDYRFGFIKRGFVGTLTAALDAINILPQTETTIRILSFITFALFCATLLLLMWRIVLTSNWSGSSFLVVAVFATSPAVVMNAHLMGYFDHIFMILTFISAWLVIRDRVWTAAIVAAVAVLVHESVVVVGLPIVILAAYVRLRTTNDEPNYRRMLPIFILPALAFLALAGAEALRSAPGYLSILLEFRLQTFPFIAEDRARLVPMWLTTSMPSYLQSQSLFVLERLRDHSTLIVVPTVIMLVVFSLWNNRKYRVPYAAVAVIAATMLPMVLHIIAWDTGRISAYSILAAFGCAWVYSEMNPVRQLDDSPRVLVWTLAFAAIIFNIFVRETLMDTQFERFSNMTRIVLYSPLLIAIVIFAFVEQQRIKTIQPDMGLLQQQ